MKKLINIPIFLHEIHGKEATFLGLFTTYIAAIIFGIFGLMASMHYGVELWKSIIIGLLFLDVGGGVVANLTSSTNLFYKTKSKRLLFLIIHITQPLILAVLFNEYSIIILSLATLIIVGGIIITFTRGVENQQNIAGLLTVVIAIALSVFNLPTFLLIFYMLYTLKLLIGFSVHRPDLRFLGK
jgi:hypothetical protein